MRHGHSAHGPDHQVRPGVIAIWPCLPKGRDGHDDEVGVTLPERVVVEPPPAQVRGPLRLDKNVGFRQKPVQQVPGTRVIDIEGEASLAEIQVLEEGAALGVGRVPDEGRHAAADVASQRLQLHDVRADIGQHAGGQRGRKELAPFENADAVKEAQRGGYHVGGSAQGCSPFGNGAIVGEAFSPVKKTGQYQQSPFQQADEEGSPALRYLTAR